MTWDPKEPWGKKSDPLEAALKQAKTQFTDLIPSGGLKNLLPSGGVRNILIAGVLILLVWQSVFIVAPDEEGVVKRFGVPVRTADPGPHFKIPFVETVLQPKVEKLFRVEVGFRTTQQGRQQRVLQEALMLTGDMNILGIEFIVQYKIKEARDFLFNVADIDETIGKAAEASMREVVGKSKIDEALTTGKAVIQADTMTLLQTILDQYQSGVQIAAVQLQDVDPPEAVAAAFKDVTNAKEDREKVFARMQAEREQQAKQYRAEGAEEAQKIRSEAEKDLEIILAQA
ncbi:MAG: FtsH protease activity modulator HflK [Nitrospira sp.]|nr:FtsH protease activity modulator HflK [Nitrospira sp.]